MAAWTLQRSVDIKHLRERRYTVFAASEFTDFGNRLQAADPNRFRMIPIHWNKFPDGTDDITIEGFTPTNCIAGEHILFLASFHNNDVTLSQFSVLIVLLQSFIETMTIVLPYYPVGTMERVDMEGKVATANTYSILLSSLPSVGPPNRLMIYDIHTLQNRFYFHSSTISDLHSTIPLLLNRLESSPVNCVCFPDEGAAKRFGKMFASHESVSWSVTPTESGTATGRCYDVVVCGKTRDGQKRKVCIQDGDCAGKHVVIVDDLVQSGGTIYECARALQAHGAASVSAFVAHAVFPNGAWKLFCKSHNGERAILDKFWVTNSIPSVVQNLPLNDCFEVLDLLDLVVKDL